MNGERNIQDSIDLNFLFFFFSFNILALYYFPKWINTLFAKTFHILLAKVFLTRLFDSSNLFFRR